MKVTVKCFTGAVRSSLECIISCMSSFLLYVTKPCENSGRQFTGLYSISFQCPATVKLKLECSIHLNTDMLTPTLQKVYYCAERIMLLIYCKDLCMLAEVKSKCLLSLLSSLYHLSLRLNVPNGISNS